MRLALEKTNASPVWPPSGIALAAVLLLGYRVWPGILLGAFFANVVAFLANQAASARTIVVVSSAIGLGNTLEAVVAAYLLQRWVGARSPFDRAQDVFRFTAAALLACCVAASVVECEPICWAIQAVSNACPEFCCTAASCCCCSAVGSPGSETPSCCAAWVSC